MRRGEERLEVRARKTEGRWGDLRLAGEKWNPRSVQVLGQKRKAHGGGSPGRGQRGDGSLGRTRRSLLGRSGEEERRG